jgi:two-component system, OmpR family, response regulator ChvI
MTVASNSSALFSPQSAVVPPKMRVLFVEDDDECREALSAELGDHGLDVESFRDGRSMLDGIAADADADVALLDWNLPDIPGIDLALELNRRSVKFPIVFLTGQALGTSHEMLAFERGALDFIDKSRGVPVIVKRLRTITRPGRAKPELEPERLICQGRLTLRPKVSRALWDGMDVDLTVTEYRIVKLLVVEAGRFFSYRQVYDCMHYAGFMAGCGDDGYRVNVRSAMKRIRNKFRVFAPGFAEIENHPGLGYRWRPRD